LIVYNVLSTSKNDMKHLSHSETGLPPRWEKYAVSVEYRRLAHEPQDYTDLMLGKFYTAEPFRDEGHIESFKKESREQLHRLRGLTLLSLAKLECGTITPIHLAASCRSTCDTASTR
jgi:hypothetical protein